MLVPKNRSGVLFKYEAYWDDHEECGDIIKQGWSPDRNQNNCWEDMLERTKKCKKTLQTWHHKTFKRANEELHKLKKCLADLTALNTEDVDWAAVNKVQKEIDEVWKREEKYWGQRPIC